MDLFEDKKNFTIFDEKSIILENWTVKNLIENLILNYKFYSEEFSFLWLIIYLFWNNKFKYLNSF